MSKNTQFTVGVDPHEEHVTTVCRRLEKLLIDKHHDYGHMSNPVLCPNMDVSQSILVRMSDKIQRLSNLLSGVKNDIDETEEDTVMDLAGYCVLYLVQKGY